MSRLRRCALYLALLALPPPAPAGPVGAAARLHERGDPQRPQQAAVVPLRAVLARVRALQPRRIIEIEFDDEALRYEIEIMDEQGWVRKLYYDAKTGNPLPGDE